MLTVSCRVVVIDIRIQNKCGLQLVRTRHFSTILYYLTGLSTNSGGWWVRPSNWKSNTFIVAAGIAGICYLVGNVSASKEVRLEHPALHSFIFNLTYFVTLKYRYIAPAKDIPSAKVR